jgi:hypothetical protein
MANRRNKGKKLIECSKPIKKVPTNKMDGRRKEGAYSGLFDGSAVILPLKPMSETSLSGEKDRLEEIKKRKLEEKLKQTARSKRRFKTKSDTYNKNNSARTTKYNTNEYKE